MVVDFLFPLSVSRCCREEEAELVVGWLVGRSGCFAWFVRCSPYSVLFLPPFIFRRYFPEKNIEMKKKGVEYLGTATALPFPFDRGKKNKMALFTPLPLQ